jgi:hypothetical protein
LFAKYEDEAVGAFTSSFFICIQHFQKQTARGSSELKGRRQKWGEEEERRRRRERER